MRGEIGRLEDLEGWKAGGLEINYGGMVMKRKWMILLSAALLIQLFAGGLALAQQGGPFDLTWSTIDGGGGASSGGSYRLAGTIGQPDVGTLNGGSYTVKSGFWAGGQTPNQTNPGSAPGVLVNQIYLPLVMK